MKARSSLRRPPTDSPRRDGLGWDGLRRTAPNAMRSDRTVSDGRSPRPRPRKRSRPQARSQTDGLRRTVSGGTHSDGAVSVGRSWRPRSDGTVPDGWSQRLPTGLRWDGLRRDGLGRTVSDGTVSDGTGSGEPVADGRSPTNGVRRHRCRRYGIGRHEGGRLIARPRRQAVGSAAPRTGPIRLVLPV